MVFQVPMLDVEKNEEVIALYDSINNTFLDMDGKNLLDKKILDSVRSQKRADRITLGFGFECNMDCSYCLQSKDKSKILEENVEKAIAEINSRTDKTRVEFWGGEALLHLDTIKYIVSKIGKHHEKFVSTNGLLLSKEVIDYFAENNFQVSVSHDGINQHLRGVDSIERNLENFKYAKKKIPISFNFVMTKPSDVEANIKYFKEKLGSDTVISSEGYVDIHDHTDREYSTYPQFSVEEEFALRAMYLEEFKKYQFEVFKIMSMFANRTKVDLSKTTKCMIGTEFLQYISLTDVQGSCHNYSDNDPINYLMSREKCQKCPLIAFCRGGCPKISSSSKGFEYNCSHDYASYMASFVFALIILTNHKYSINYKGIRAYTAAECTTKPYNQEKELL